MADGWGVATDESVSPVEQRVRRDFTLSIALRNCLHHSLGGLFGVRDTWYNERNFRRRKPRHFLSIASWSCDRVITHHHHLNHQ